MEEMNAKVPPAKELGTAIGRRGRERIGYFVMREIRWGKGYVIFEMIGKVVVFLLARIMPNTSSIRLG